MSRLLRFLWTRSPRDVSYICWAKICRWSKYLFSSEYRRKRRQEALIAKALETPEGRNMLAVAMVEPIRRQLDYERVSRRLLMVDELPQAMYAQGIGSGFGSGDDDVTTVVTTASVMPSPLISLPESGRIGIGTFQTGYVGTAGMGSFAIGTANSALGGYGSFRQDSAPPADGTYGSFRLGRPQNARKPYPVIMLIKT